MSEQSTLSESELGNARHNLNLLRSQMKSGRLDANYLKQQLDTWEALFNKVEGVQKHLKKEGRFQALYTVSRLLGSSLDLQTVLDQVMDAIIQLTRAERGFLMLRDDDGQIAVKAARNLDQQTLTGEKFQFSRTITNQIFDTGIPVLTNNAVEDPRFSRQASIVDQSLRSIMATPLRARGRVFGAVYVDNRMFSGLFNEDDLAALDTFAGQAAVAIDNARLFSATDQALARRVEELSELRRVDSQLNETLDADKATQLTLDWVCRLVDASSGHLALLGAEADQLTPSHHYGLAEDAPRPTNLYTLYPESAAVMRDLKPTMLQKQDDVAYALALVPIHRESRAFGMVVIRRDGQAAFTADEVDLIERLIVRAAVSIENAQLYAKVRAADKAKSEFVGIVAHDLKVPMTSIMGYADLTRVAGPLSDQQASFVQKVKDNVVRMQMLVSDLADISRIESGHFFMNETRVPVLDVVQAVQDATRTQIDAYQHHFNQAVEGDLPDMQVDFYRLVQVLTNLVSNAYKYTPDGGQITFHVGRDAKSGRVLFAVQDTGIGLSPQAIANLGKKFWRADDDFTRSRPGTGLGFAITRSLVEQMGSTIVIDSTVGKGSTFSFSIAAAQA